ncbi:putative ABC transport system ATP-binding protein [Nakamurella sp. UYEF19]
MTLGFATGSFTAVMGPSGSGKSTLLHCASGLDRPTSGTVYLQDCDLATLDEAALTRLRRCRIGFIFQSFNLLPTLTVRQNVTLPLELAGRSIDAAAVRRLLGVLGLSDRMDHLPGQLSGGQQQRAAIARAVLTEPAVIFADEPTGALDGTAAREVLRLIQRTVREWGRTVVMVTHDPVAASYAQRVVFLANGEVADTMEAPTAAAVAAAMARLGGLPAGS